MTRSELAREILRVARLTGEFRLRSGATTSEYFDKYRFEADPALLREIASHLVPLLPSNVDVLAGLELGGVAIVTALSLATGLPAAFVRKEAKPYGTERLAEGSEIGGRRVLVVEDVVTSGGQVIQSASALRERGAVVDHALCVIDREAGGAGALGAEGIRLASLFRRSDLSRATTDPAVGDVN